MYDSRTDRADFSGPHWETDKPWRLRSHFGYEDPKGKKMLKRAASKADRRSEFPRTQFRGYGYGKFSMKYYYW